MILRYDLSRWISSIERTDALRAIGTAFLVFVVVVFAIMLLLPGVYLNLSEWSKTVLPALYGSTDKSSADIQIFRGLFDHTIFQFILIFVVVLLWVGFVGCIFAPFTFGIFSVGASTINYLIVLFGIFGGVPHLFITLLYRQPFDIYPIKVEYSAEFVSFALSAMSISLLVGVLLVRGIYSLITVDRKNIDLFAPLRRDASFVSKVAYISGWPRFNVGGNKLLKRLGASIVFLLSRIVTGILFLTILRYSDSIFLGIERIALACDSGNIITANSRCERDGFIFWASFGLLINLASFLLMSFTSKVLFLVSRLLFVSCISDYRLSDARPALLFLRRFNLDKTVLRRRSFFLPMLWSNAWRPRSVDEVLAHETYGQGPLIALGDPNDPKSKFGPPRIRIENDSWQDCISDLIIEAGSIVLVIGPGESISFEIQKLFTNGQSCNTIFLLPPDLGSGPDGISEQINLIMKHLDASDALYSLTHKDLEGCIGFVFVDGGIALFDCKRRDWLAYLLAIRAGLRLLEKSRSVRGRVAQLV